MLVPEGSAPVLLSLEDVHAADDSSIRLLRFLLRRLHSARCMVVLTHRPVEPAADLAGLLADVAREFEFTRIVLPPLRDVEVRTYLERILIPHASPEVVAATIERAEGHPFFLTEIVRMLSGRFGITQPASTAEQVAGIPRTVSEVIGRRLAALSDETRRTLLAASVIGRDFDLRMLSHVTALDLDTVLDRAEEGAAAGLVEELPGGVLGYRFDHALTHQTLYERLPAPRRIVLHGRVAAALAGGLVGPVEIHLGELARHRCASTAECGVSAAVEAAVLAGDNAASRLAYEEAVRLYRLGLDTLRTSGAEPARCGPLLISLSLAQQRSGHPEPAREGFLEAARLARAQRNADQLAAAALGLGTAFEAQGFDPELVELLQEALASGPSTGPHIRARLLARLSIALNLNDPEDIRQALSSQALAVARELADPWLDAVCLSAHVLAIWGSDRHEERTRHAADALRLAEDLEDRELTLDALTWSACDLLERADRVGWNARLAQHAELAATTRHPLHLYHVSMWRAAAAAVDGRAEEALQLAGEAAALGGPVTELAGARQFAVVAVVLRDQGRWLELVPTLELIAAGQPILPTWRGVRALMDLDNRECGSAEQLIKQLPEDVAKFVPRDANWVPGMMMLAEIVSALEDVEVAGRLFAALAPHSGD